MSNENIIVFTSNRYMYYININNPRIIPLFAYYRQRINSPRWPISDQERLYFEKIIINMCMMGHIRVPDWAIHCQRINAFKHPRWLAFSKDVVYSKDGIEILYGDIRDEIKLLDKILYFKDYELTEKDYDVLNRIMENDKRTAELVDNCIKKKVAQ